MKKHAYAGSRLRFAPGWADVDYLDLLDNASDLIHSATPDGRLLYANRAWLETLEYTADELAGLTIFDVVHPDHQARCADTLRRIISGDNVGAIETIFVTKSGKEVAVEGTANCRFVGGVPHSTRAIFRDVSARKRSQAALRRANDFTEAILEAAGNLVGVLDRQGRIVRFNKACQKISGYSAAEVEGKYFWEIFLSREEQEAIKGTFSQRTATSFPYTFEYNWLMRDGSRRLITWTNTALMDRNGAPEFIIGVGVDITEQRKAEQALRESEARFRSAFDDAVTGMAIIGLDGRYLRVNSAFCEMLGYSEQELLALTFPEISSPEDADTGLEMSAKALSGELDSFQLEKRYYHKQGHVVWAAISVSLVHDAQGMPLYFISQVQNITQRKEVEDALRGSEERYRSLFEHSIDAILLVTTEGRVLAANPEARRIFGRTEQELREVTPADVTDALDPNVYALTQERIRTGKVRGEIAFTRKDGTRFPGEVSVGVFRDSSGEDRMSLFVRDITERKRAEEAQRFLLQAGSVLASSLDYKATLSALARLAVSELADYCMVDLVEEDGTARRVAVAHADPAVEELIQRLMNYPPELTAANPISQVLNSGLATLVRQVRSEIVVAASAERDDEFRQIIELLKPRSSMIVPLATRGKVLGAISLVSSASGRVFDDADLALAEELARRAAIAVENARLYRQAQEAVKAREDLLSIVSHDLKNYLMVVKGFAYILPEFVPHDGAANSEQLLDGLGQIDMAALQMDMLVHDLLDFARQQVGKPLDLFLQRTDLVELARHIAAQQQRTTPRHHIVVEAEVPSLEGRWDRSRLERALANMLSNAIKYSPGPGDIVVRLREDLEAGTHWAVLSVADHGIGIPARDLPYIFDRFSRAGNAGKISGTGIGLSSVKQIVEQHGGNVSVTSEEGVGTTFEFRIPAAPSH